MRIQGLRFTTIVAEQDLFIGQHGRVRTAIVAQYQFYWLDVGLTQAVSYLLIVTAAGCKQRSYGKHQTWSPGKDHGFVFFTPM